MAFIITTCNRRMSENPEGKGRLSTNLKKVNAGGILAE
jgi:hypothetical protein